MSARRGDWRGGRGRDRRRGTQAPGHRSHWGARRPSPACPRPRWSGAPPPAPAAPAAPHRSLGRESAGGEVDPPSFVETIESVAKADASTAWCLCQAAGCSMVAAFVPPDIAATVFRDKRAVLAWGPGPGRAVAAPGGYRVSGKWSFASGGRHASWLGGICAVVEADGTPRREADGTPSIRTLLFPASQATITRILPVNGPGRT